MNKMVASNLIVTQDSKKKKKIRLHEYQISYSLEIEQS